MLQVDKRPPVPDVDAAAAESSPAELLTAIIGFVRRQFAILATVVLLALALGAVYLFTAPPRYTAQAMMIIDTHKVQLFQQQSVLGDVAIDSATVESQVEILKSENISLSVIKDLHLTEDAEFVGSGGGLLGTALGFVPSLFSSSAEPKSEFELTRRAVVAFRRALAVRRVGLTYVIEIDVQSLDPEKAAQIANGVADAYIVDQLEAKYQATRRASAWLQSRIGELRQQASTAERAALDFKQKNNIVDTGGRLINEQQLSELNSQLVIARAASAEARARLDRIAAITQAEIPDIAVADVLRKPDAAVSDALRNDVITKLRSQYLDLANREADWSNRLGKNHLAAVQLRNQMREIRKSIFDELRRIAETFKSDVEIAKARESSIEKDLSDAVAQSQSTNQAQVALRELESSAQTYRALYDNFLQRYMEAIQQQSFPITEARLISQASRPLSKSSPNAALVLAISSTGGLLLAFGFAFLAEVSDRGFRTTDQVEKSLQTDCVAVLPRLKGDALKPAAKGPAAATELGGAQQLMPSVGLLAHVVDAPFSRFTESIRALKVAADLNAMVKANKVIAVTSALPNEGKSTVAANFAQLIAHGKGRAILVDGDLRNPSLSRKLAPGAAAGLLDVLAGRASLEQAVWTDPSTGLAFLPLVAKGRLSHTNEILASEAMKKLIDGLRDAYDYVVVDLPPLAPVVDVRATTQIVDSYIFVVEWGHTRIDVVERALGSAQGVYDRLLGVALNKADLDIMHRYESYGRGYGYYHNKYYARYGYGQ
jgi:succinoglycan biosynthesis transport protein ExoP